MKLKPTNTCITSNVPGFQPVIINGRPLKSANQFYNSQRALIQSLSKMPTYKAWKLSGKRTHRGFYVTNNKVALNADINGSYNIFFKAFPKAFACGTERL